MSNNKSMAKEKDKKNPKKEEGADEIKHVNVIDTEITDELKKSYLDYAMSVIVSRALPDVRDGLKPVHRRILYTMHELNLSPGGKTRKSAKIVGDVTGNYHPHGGAAVYEAMVKLAQEFGMRYPLVIGQGNFGSIDGDNAAADRYTEAKMSKISMEMLSDIEKETVDWRPNYEGTRQEPVVLPASVPNLLLNGTLGIAVGMATNIPPHNLSELIDATIYLADNPKATAEDLMEFIKGPDFPTGGVIYNKKDILEAYNTGKGAITMRGVAEVKEKDKSRGHFIEITEIPYQVNKSSLIMRMAELVQEKKIDGIKNIIDQSDKRGMSILIELKNDAVPQKVLNRLFKYTDMQKNFNVNTVALTDQGMQPQLMTMKEILAAFVTHRQEVVRRRAEYDLKRARERAHILEGLSKALHSIDKVIATIKKSKSRDDARMNLMKQFRLTEIQTNAILDMRLSTLAALERQRIEDELAEKKKLITELESLLQSEKKILGVIKNELKEIKEKYGDARRTRVVAGGLTDFAEEDLIKEEETMITLSQGGYIKRVNPDSFKSQHRGGKGLIGSDVNEEDFLTEVIYANTHDNILFFTDRGRVFQTKVYEIPEASRTAKGKPIHNFLEIPIEEKVNAVVTYPKTLDKKSTQFLVMATEGGVIKKTPLTDFDNVRRTGIIAIKLRNDDSLHWVKLSTGKDEVILTTMEGQAIRFKESDARPMGRATAGVTAIKLKGKDKVSSMNVIKAETDIKKTRLLVVMEKGYGKQTPINQYKIQKRSGSGILTANVTDKTGKVIDAYLVNEEEEILALSAKGQVIRTEIISVRTAGRATQGVKIMNLKPGDKLVGIICF